MRECWVTRGCAAHHVEVTGNAGVARGRAHVAALTFAELAVIITLRSGEEHEIAIQNMDTVYALEGPLRTTRRCLT